MSALLDKIYKAVNVTENRTLAIIQQIMHSDPNLTMTVDKDDASSVTEAMDKLNTTSTIVLAEVQDALDKNYNFVMTRATVELFATIVDVIQAEDVLIRKMTFMPVEARHGFIQVGQHIIELISEIVKEHG